MKNHRSISDRNESSQQGVFIDDADGADPKLLDLVRLRVAQIHQCPDSIEKHMEELRAQGEAEKRLDELETWETSDLFDARERAALALCEKITSDPAESLPDYLIQETRHYFTKGAIVTLTLAIMSVNDWHFFGGH